MCFMVCKFRGQEEGKWIVEEKIRWPKFCEEVVILAVRYLYTQVCPLTSSWN